MGQRTDKKLLLPHELARVLNVSVGWVYSHASPNAKFKIPAKRVGGLLRFDLDEVIRFLDKQEASNA
jgi:hypothetical protein